MTLLNAPAYNQRREDLKRNILVGGGILIVALTVIALLGFFLGHGWFFSNLPIEHKVSVFMETVQQGDYAKAYGLWMNDPAWQQHPQNYDYKLDRFTEDWTTASDWGGPVKNFHVDVSKKNATGVVVAVTINGSKKLFLYYHQSDGTMTYSPNILQY